MKNELRMFCCSGWRAEITNNLHLELNNSCYLEQKLAGDRVVTVKAGSFFAQVNFSFLNIILKTSQRSQKHHAYWAESISEKKT